MKETKVYMFDDLAYAAGERVEADETVTLRLDSESVALDLTEAHAKELRDLLAPYFAVRPVPATPALAPPKGGRRPTTTRGCASMPTLAGSLTGRRPAGCTTRRRCARSMTSTSRGAVAVAKIIKMVDDLAFADGGRQVEADVTVRLAYGRREVELDLTEAHELELDTLLAPYFAAGSPAAPPPGPARGRRPPSAAGVTMRPRSAAERAAIRAWANGHGLSYKSSGGSTYYGRDLLEKWDAHKAETGWTEEAAR